MQEIQETDEIQEKHEIGKIILSVLSKLETCPDTLDKEYMFCSGMVDNNERQRISDQRERYQTKFERLSNDLKIGTRARSETVGLCLLFFLRLIIDNSWGLPTLVYYDLFEGEKPVEDLTNEELIDIFKVQEWDFMDKAPIDGEISRELVGCGGSRIITAKADEIKLWNLSRVRKGIRKLYNLEDRGKDLTQTLELIRKRKRKEGDPFWKGMPKQFIPEFIENILRQEESGRNI